MRDSQNFELKKCTECGWATLSPHTDCYAPFPVLCPRCNSDGRTLKPCLPYITVDDFETHEDGWWVNNGCAHVFFETMLLKAQQ